MSHPKYNFVAADLIKAGRTTQFNVDEIRKWLKDNRNIPDLSDEQIILFLLACNNNLDQATETIELYYKHRCNAPEFFTNRDAFTDDFMKHFNTSEMAAFPRHTPENNAVLYSRLRNTNYYNFFVEQQIKLLFMCLDVLLHTNPPDGLIVIMDMKGIGLMHLTRLKISPIRKFFSYLQEALPCQLKYIHILNCNYLFDKILMICKPFMKKELINMIMTHPPTTDYSGFQEKYVPANCLPEDYNGDLPPLNQLNEDTLKQLQHMQAFFAAEEKQAEQCRK